MQKRITGTLLAALLSLGGPALTAEVPPADPVPDESGAAYTVLQDTAVLPVCRVSLPTEFPFVIDPYEIAGRGTVYSEPFPITNSGTEPVRVQVTAACYAVSPDVRFLEAPADREGSLPDKEIQLILRGGNGPEAILLPDSRETLSFDLAPGETTALELTGSANLPAEIYWQEGEVRVSMRFHLEPTA